MILSVDRKIRQPFVSRRGSLRNGCHRTCLVADIDGTLILENSAQQTGLAWLTHLIHSDR